MPLEKMIKWLLLLAIQGRQLLAFGSAVKHLETLGGLIDALENNDTVQLNRLNNLWKKQTGQTQSLTLRPQRDCC